jgi:trehalose 6-phosphate phosphatase
VRSVLEALQASPALFIDYDGTLTPIADQPASAILSRSMRERLERLAARCPIAIVSGRDRDDVRDRVGLRQLAYAGSHGYDIIGPFERFEHRVGEESRGVLLEIGGELKWELSTFAGVTVEEKRFSIAVHFRQSPEQQVPELRERVQEKIARAGFAMTEGKKTFDIRPYADWHKGTAVRWLIGALGANARQPVYLGDDANDELAFMELSEGVTIKVGGGPSSARFTLQDVDEVGRFLDALAHSIGT